jgi:ubiquinone/menaquinone biosynthesis C-methylase UbiE
MPPMANPQEEPEPEDPGEKKKTVSDFFTGASTVWEEHYTGSAADYRVHFFAQRRERVLAALGDPEGRKILDLGCASGDLTFALAMAGATVVGADLTRGMVHRAELRRRNAPEPFQPAAARASFMVADAEALPFADGSFHAATCIGVMEYVPDDRLGVGELYRVLKPGGRLVITAPHQNAPAHRLELALFGLAGFFKRRPPQAFHRNYAVGRLRKLLADAGFAVRGCRFVSYLPYNVAIRLPQAASLDRMLRRAFEGGPAEGLGVTMVLAADKPA